MTKNILFLLIGFSILNIVNAQTFSITPSDSVYVAETVGNSNDEVILYAYVKNDSSDDLLLNGESPVIIHHWLGVYLIVTTPIALI